MTATASPKRSTKRPAVWGVSAISGTRTIADRPPSRAAATARRYTSVFPEPVTPWRRRGFDRAAMRAAIFARAALWAAVGSTAPARAPTGGAARPGRGGNRRDRAGAGRGRVEHRVLAATEARRRGEGVAAVVGQ